MKITYVGHSTVLIRCNDVTVLTDPLLTKTVLGLPRRLPATPSLDDIKDINVVTISHAHADHLHIPSLKKIIKKFPKVIGITPINIANYLKRIGFLEVYELLPYKSFALNRIGITSIPLPHVKGRWFSFQNTGTCGYVFSCNHKRILVAGDIDFTGSLKVFEEIGKRFPLNVALLPISGMMPVSYYEKRQGRRGVHIDPKTSLDIFCSLKADTLIPIHWGSVSLRLSAIDEAPKRLLQLAKHKGIEHKIKILFPGETYNV